MDDNGDGDRGKHAYNPAMVLIILWWCRLKNSQGLFEGLWTFILVQCIVWLIEYWHRVCLTALLQGWCFSVKYTDRLVMSPHKIANQHQSTLGQVFEPFKHDLNWGWKDICYHKSCRCLKSPHLSQQITRSRRSGLKALRACANPNFPGVLCCLISWFFLGTLDMADVFF